MLQPVTSRSGMESLHECLVVDRHATYANYCGMRFATFFQPLISLSHQRIIAYEALMRGVDSNGYQIDITDVFRVGNKNGHHVFIDRLLNLLHLKNAGLQNLQNHWVCLNISPRAIIEGDIKDAFYERLFDELNLEPSRIVIEIVETPIIGEDRLAEACAVFKDLGCLVAIDDFGAGHSNFQRIWKIKPDLVKFDRETILHAEQDMTVRRSLPGLVSLFHEAGCLVAIEGIDSREQVFIAMDADVDFVQGHYFAKPTSAAVADSKLSASTGTLLKEYQQKSVSVLHTVDDKLQGYMEKFQACAARVAELDSIEDACRPFLNESLVQRCFLINSRGVQIGEAIEAPIGSSELDAKFAPLSRSAGANWYRRQYYRRAIQNPDKVQVSKPYLSLRDAQYCITLSITMEISNDIYVLCADINWDQFCA